MISGSLHIHPSAKGSINKKPKISVEINPKKQIIGLVRYSNGMFPSVKGLINKKPKISVGINLKKQIVGLVRYYGDEHPEPYEGEYEVTPSPNEQILETNNKLLSRNVVIRPIPSNYGLITWDGSVLTVS